jgi:hypothetical protein
MELRKSGREEMEKSRNTEVMGAEWLWDAFFQILGWHAAEITSLATAQAKACLPPFGGLRWNKFYVASFFS